MHVLVVGGTGMLRGVSLYFAGKGDTVTVLARRPERLGPNAPVCPLAVDYTDERALAGGLRGVLKEHGPIGLAVCSIDRERAPHALPSIAAELAAPGIPFRLYLVRGSAGADPNRPRVQALQTPPSGCTYREVILGWVSDGHRSRWLTHEEICTGVIRAVEQDERDPIVGTVRPWEGRPGW